MRSLLLGRPLTSINASTMTLGLVGDDLKLEIDIPPLVCISLLLRVPR